MSEWQDISTAPKDELIFAVDRKRGYASLVISDGAEWEALTFEGSRTGTGFYPTHWMPLPPPPAQEGE